MNTLAMQIVRALRGEWYGTSGRARCPSHADRTPSLAITNQDGRLLIVIFADNDDVGREAAERTAKVHRFDGRSVEIRLPAVGTDFNDELILAGQS